MKSIYHQRGAQGKHAAGKEPLALVKENMVSQNYLDVVLKAFTCANHMRIGEERQGVLTMVEEDERFEFHERSREAYVRNPKVFEGEYINVHLDKSGALVVNLHRTELTTRRNAARDGEAIKTELLTAIKVLGL